MRLTRISALVLATVLACISVLPGRTVAHADDQFWYSNNSFTGPTGLVDAVEVSGGQLYVSGHFAQVDGQPIHHVARWDGSQWHPVGTGIGEMGLIHRLLIDGNNIYVAGMMGQAGDIAVRNLALWNGEKWDAMGGGTDRAIRAIVKGPDGSIYVGGEFTEAGGVPARGIARWDGQQWYALGTGIDNHVSSLAVIGPNVFVGGAFQIAGGQFANYIARWDGSAWHPLMVGELNGVDNLVTALAAKDGQLYVGGIFRVAGDITANGIARWDGASWAPLGRGVAGRGASVRAIVPVGSDIFIGGFFTMAGDTPANYVARWDGTSWYELGSGTNNAVKAMARLGDVLYVGGEFTSAGGKRSEYFAEWHDPRYVSAVEVSVDVKPGNCKNELNLMNGGKNNGKGMAGGIVHVALAGTADLDVRDIDLATVTLQGVSPVHSKYEDATSPADGCACPGGKDGYVDVVLKFRHQDIVGAIGPLTDGERVELLLAGSLLDGQEISGHGCVRVKSSKGGTLPDDGISGVALHQNHPNPFNPATTIAFELRVPAAVRLAVYDAAGALVAVLLDEVRSEGVHQVQWNGRNSSGHAVTSGIYFYVLESDAGRETRKMMLLK